LPKAEPETVVGLKLLRQDGSSIVQGVNRTVYHQGRWEAIRGNGSYITVGAGDAHYGGLWSGCGVQAPTKGELQLCFIEARNRNHCPISRPFPVPWGVRCYRVVRWLKEPCPERLNPELLEWLRTNPYTETILSDEDLVALGFKEPEPEPEPAEPEFKLWERRDAKGHPRPLYRLQSPVSVMENKRFVRWLFKLPDGGTVSLHDRWLVWWINGCYHHMWMPGAKPIYAYAAKMLKEIPEEATCPR